MKGKKTGQGDAKKSAGMGKADGRRRPRLTDVAKRAGVGIATVDRVLNERGHVSPRTSEKVLDAAKALGLPRILPPLYRRGIRIEVLIARRESEFVARLKAAFRRVAATLDHSLIVEQSNADEDRPEEVAKRIRESTCDAMIFFGQEVPEVIEAVTMKMSVGVPVVTVVSDLPTTPRLAYVGIDHYKAGRAAAFFVAHMVKQNGAVLVACHNLGFSAHANRIRGFQDGLERYAPWLDVSGVFETEDEQDRTERFVSEQLERNDRNVVAIYNGTGANRGIGRAIQSVCVAEGAARPIFVGYELTEHTSKMLAEGIMTLVIDQNAQGQAPLAMDVVLSHFGYLDKEEVESAVPFSIISPENLTP